MKVGIDSAMPRPQYRACLEDGLKLDLNKLARRGFIKFGTNIGARGIACRNSHQGDASAVVSADKIVEVSAEADAHIKQLTGGDNIIARFMR